jgi:hypothetical protein
LKRTRVAAAILTAVMAPSACGSRGDATTQAAPPIASGPLPDGIVARVGADSIRGESVARIAALQHVDVRSARERAVRDALFAAAATADGIDVEASVRGVLARRLLRSLRAEAEKTPITADELTAAAERREQRGNIPATIVAPELLEADIFNARAQAAMGEILAARQARAERVKDADALLALVPIER